MHDDYLWDGSGDLDAEGAQMLALQRTLAPLRYEPEPVRVPRATPSLRRASASSGWGIPVLVAAVAAAVVLVLSLGSHDSPGSGVGVVVVSAQARDSAELDEPASEPEPEGPLAPVATVSGPKEPETARPAAETPAPTQLPESSKPPRRAAKPRRARSRTPAPVEPDRSQPRPNVPQAEPISVDCILDPRRCPAAGTKNASPGSSDKVPTVDCVLDPSKCDPLPDTLSSSDIRSGMRLAKPRVEACGLKHHAPARQKVKVKLAILGATGRVLDAHAMGTVADTPLGRCIEKAVSKARFPKFKRPRLGAVYPFTMPGPKSAPKASQSAEKLMKEVSGRVKSKARGCALVHDIPSGTHVEIELKVSATGKVTKVRVIPRDPISGDATRCLNTAIRKLVVSPSSSGVNGRIPLSL